MRKARKTKTPSNPPKKRDLTDFEWTCLVGAWRYYEHRNTIAASMFPRELVWRYFGEGNPYSEKARMAIAEQFVSDHHRGEEDWADERWECDKIPWSCFYNFCKGYSQGFQTVKVKNPNTRQKQSLPAFYTAADKKWRNSDLYISRGETTYIDPAFIVSTSCPSLS